MSNHPLLLAQKYAKLNLFLQEEGFSRSNLERVNSFNVTPLTLALESKKNHKFVKELLELGANPMLENAHGNTPLHLAQSEPEIYFAIKNAIKKRTCIHIKAEEGAIFSQNGINYQVVRLIRGGSSSIKLIEIKNLATDQRSVLKIKSRFNGIELRNYIFMHKYEDFFLIKDFILGDLHFHNVYALKQKLVPGLPLSSAINKQKNQATKDQIIYQAIIALCNFHRHGFVHRDALPDNAHWNPETERVEFIDYDIMRTNYDINTAMFAGTVIYDFRRLLLGCITRHASHIKGLGDYTPNLSKIIDSIPPKILDPKLKSRIHRGLSKGLILPTSTTVRSRSIIAR